MLNFLKRLFGIASTTAMPPVSRAVDTSMNEGDVHSGPHGYSPNTPYVETQYGSGFDEEAEWNEEHHK